jgi:hypothetical protein
MATVNGSGLAVYRVQPDVEYVSKAQKKEKKYMLYSEKSMYGTKKS